MSDIKLDSNAAVVGGVHSDSHDIHNNYTNNTTSNTTNNSTVNNNTVYEAQKTQQKHLYAERNTGQRISCVANTTGSI